MKFDYNGTRYDLRLKDRYLPKELRQIGSLDRMVMLDRRTSDEVKQRILTSYLNGAILAKA